MIQSYCNIVDILMSELQKIIVIIDDDTVLGNLVIAKAKHIVQSTNEEIRIFRINKDDATALLKKYRIKEFPVMLLFKKGRMYGRLTGIKYSSRILRI